MRVRLLSGVRLHRSGVCARVYIARMRHVQTCLVGALVAHVEKQHNITNTATKYTDEALQHGLSLVAALFTVEMCRVLSYGACWAISYR